MNTIYVTILALGFAEIIVSGHGKLQNQPKGNIMVLIFIHTIEHIPEPSWGLAISPSPPTDTVTTRPPHREIYL